MKRLILIFIIALLLVYVIIVTTDYMKTDTGCDSPNEKFDGSVGGSQDQGQLLFSNPKQTLGQGEQQIKNLSTNLGTNVATNVVTNTGSVISAPSVQMNPQSTETKNAMMYQSDLANTKHVPKTNATPGRMNLLDGLASGLASGLSNRTPVPIDRSHQQNLSPSESDISSGSEISSDINSEISSGSSSSGSNGSGSENLTPLVEISTSVTNKPSIPHHNPSIKPAYPNNLNPSAPSIKPNSIKPNIVPKHPNGTSTTLPVDTSGEMCEPVEKKCNADKCGLDNLHPILDPRFNMRETAKQCLLLEDHLNNTKKRCYDCIRKHFLTIDGYLEEAVSLEKDNRQRDYYRQLYLEWVKLEKQYSKNPKNSDNLDDISKKIRTFRKPLVEKYFDTVSEYDD